MFSFTDEIFVLLGVDEDNRWHHRIVRAASVAQAASWWQDQIQVAPNLVLSLPELEVGISDLTSTAQSAGTSTIWGGWVHSNDKMRMIAVSADTLPQARRLIRGMMNSGERIACIVDPSPWLAVVSHCRAIVSGDAKPDTDLLAETVNC